ncbi:MAG TPA: hypothetical protein VLA78_01230, partial [Paracoccaceae bacterium]|nr:hypothetical protein [Paracoccaceae bacterium]
DAHLRLPGGGAHRALRVERITLDPAQQPRWGFPEWLRREPTVASVLLAPIDGDLDDSLIGAPFEVVFTAPVPLVERTATALAALWHPRHATAEVPAR